eukprot:CAMPEP_0170582332 /NCGR_PEP_ID=MMETSP0224-20130122/7526_1 /TAXON_ID=285029 /ORGANISM="Togula jolla, Strain CCCM 725" /LENGTH=441 /DNA_ID=CAMNT_0010905547 /DNA_START=78 /DNA_END=1403 /DNA_ORIENTATION=+
MLRSRGSSAIVIVVTLCVALVGTLVSVCPRTFLGRPPPGRPASVRRPHLLSGAPILAAQQLRQLGQRSAAADAQPVGPVPDPRPGIDWEPLGFGLTTRDTVMAVATCKLGGEWGEYKMVPYGTIPMEPAATVLNYGQALFEGMKAYRTKENRIVIFRPEMNALRMKQGAERFMMPPMPEQLFMEIVGETVRANADWVPPAGVGALYLRPLLIGSGGALGVAPSKEYSFIVYAAPVTQYFKGGGARMLVDRSHQRAAPLGAGNVKAAGNYAPCFQTQHQAKAAGFSDVIYLDVGGENIEEAAASNFFCVGSDGILRTPALGSILSGVTRDSIIRLAKDLASGDSLIKGVEVGDVSLDTALSSSEAFVTGTGAGISPLEHLSADGRSVDFPAPGPISKLLQDSIRDIQVSNVPDSFNWLWDPFQDPTGTERLAKLGKIDGFKE